MKYGIESSMSKRNMKVIEKVFQDVNFYGMGIPVLHADGRIERVDPRWFRAQMEQMQRDPGAAEQESTT